MKRPVALALVLLLCFVACADTYCNTGGRINYFYQLDGGKTDEEGTYDKLLVPVIRDITNGAHSSIVPKDNKYLTGRGCDLFSYGHAYQYLLGYAGSTQAKANILAIYLRGKSGQSHTWSSSAVSTLNPPSACALYAATLDAQPGINKYSGSVGTFSGLAGLFNGCRGLCIVNAPGHYVCAVGCTVHEGKQYVLIVDSIMSATLRNDRCGYGYSYDFSMRYDQSNAKQLEAAVHQYWMPYDTFRAKCTIKYSFYVGTAPKSYKLDSPYREAAVVREGDSFDLCVYEMSGYDDAFYFESADPSVATVDENGIITAVTPGETVIRCYSDGTSFSQGNPIQVLDIPVYICEKLNTDYVYLMQDGIYPEVLLGCTLPGCVRVYWSEDGTAVIGDIYGNEFFSEKYRLIDKSARRVVLASSVTSVEYEAFADVPVDYVFADNADIEISPDAFGEDTLLFYSVGNGWYEQR